MTVSSLLIFMIVLFLALAIFLGTPIAVALGLAAVAELILQGEVPLMIAAQRIFNGVNSVTLMGIPFFMLVGSIMERSGITQKLIDFANSLVGWLRGGLCYVGVLTGILMGGISGSACADVRRRRNALSSGKERDNRTKSCVPGTKARMRSSGFPLWKAGMSAGWPSNSIAAPAEANYRETEPIFRRIRLSLQTVSADSTSGR